MFHGADVSVAELVGKVGELQRHAPVLRRTFERGSHGRKKLYAELHGLPARPVPRGGNGFVSQYARGLSTSGRGRSAVLIWRSEQFRSGGDPTLLTGLLRELTLPT